MKRRLTKLVVFLLLGAIVNVAVAWILLLRMPQGYEFYAEPWPDYDRANVLALKDQYLDADTWPATKQLVEQEIAYEADSLLDPRLMTAPQRFEYTSEEFGAHGWRIIVIYASYTIDRYVPYERHWVVRLDSTARIDLAGWPLHFIGTLFFLERKAANDQTIWTMEKRFVEWLKFFASTAGWAVVVALLSCSLQTARRIHRKRRGECCVCGYDLRSDFSTGCPECGWRRD